MANLSESASYDAGVYQLETTDPVVGGPSGVSNAPLKNLANRTAYLKQHVDALETASSLYAPKASPTFTGNPAAPTPALGDNDTSLATTAFVQATLGGKLVKSVAGGVNVTLTAIEAGNGYLEFNGVLTANIAVIVPDTPSRPWVVFNDTTGAFTLTVKTAAGAGVAVTQTKRTLLFNDGVNVVPAIGDLLAALLSQDGAGSGVDADLLDGQHGAYYAPLASPTFTGNPQAPTPAGGDNDTSIATTEFVNAAISTGVPLASDTVAGKVEKATAAEAQAFTADKYIDGAMLAAAFQGGNQSIGASGYQKLPGGLIVQWGVVTTAGGTIAITLPITFPNAIFTALCTFGTAGAPQNPVQIEMTSTSQITVTNYANGSTTKRWVAFGN